MWINLQTEYNFGKTYGRVTDIAKYCATIGKAAGIADKDGSWGHVQFAKACKAAGIKPIFGVQLAVVNELLLKERRYAYNYMTFIAMNTNGLQEIYRLIDIAHQQYYYRPRIDYNQLNAVSNDITVLSGVAPAFDKIHRPVYLQLSPDLPLALRGIDVPAIACCDNSFITPEDRAVYEPFADERNRLRKTTPQHILTIEEWLCEFPGREDALLNLWMLSSCINAELCKADLIRYPENVDIMELCKAGAKKRHINLKDKVYGQRFHREMEMIKSKNFIDYFLVTADLIAYAKKHMVVGHARGSSAGSLVCYLLGITEIDPIPYGLVFERFIDVNRLDLPDIDIDFQDNKRHMIIEYLQDKYKPDCVAQIGNIARLKPRSAIIRFAKALRIPVYDVEEVKDAILERSGGDSRASLAMEDTFGETDIGKKFMEDHPNMRPVTKVENHPSHSGVHAAGILVCNQPITNYCGVDSRDKKRVAMIDKKDAEAINLLKIDALGLRTLTILAEVCDQLGKPYSWLYDIPLNDPKTYKVFNDHRLSGIFQFEGDAIRSISRQMSIETIDDVSALSALGRPGPLHCGGTTSFIERRTGKVPVEYMSQNPAVVNEIADTYGIIIYQEQVLNIGRNYGNLSWEDVTELRKAMSKSLGDEFFGHYKKKFVTGAMANGASEEEAESVWNQMNTMGSWSFNKSHSVSYGMISYLTAYMKANHPLEFAVASLNNVKNDEAALKMLRDLKENDGYDYVAFDRDISQKYWSVHKGKLYGGLMTVPGIGVAAADKILRCRRTGEPLPKGIASKLENPITPFTYLYPGRQVYGDYYKNPQKYGVKKKINKINKIRKNGNWTFIGKLVRKNLRDLNEIGNVAKRGGQIIEPPTAFLNITLEDDTDNIICTIGRFDYESTGRIIAETGKENKDWYMVYGQMKNNWRKIYVKNIKRITIGGKTDE